MIRHLLLAYLLLVGVLLREAAADQACDPSTCPGLESFSGMEPLRQDAVNDRNAARLAYSIGVSLLTGECCFQQVVGYLRFALEVEPALEEEFLRLMNGPTPATWGLWTRVLLAVTRNPDKPVRF